MQFTASVGSDLSPGGMLLNEKAANIGMTGYCNFLKL